MNTYFFVKVLLTTAKEQPDFDFGPYAHFKDATHILDSVPNLLTEMNINFTKYNIVIEDRYLKENEWTKINTPVQLRISEKLITTESK